MKKKIAFLFVTPAVEEDEKKYSLKRLSDLGFSILIYDITPLFAPDVDSTITKNRIHTDYILYKKIKHKKELSKIIRDDRNDTFFLPMFDDYSLVRNVYKYLTKYNARYGYVNNLVYELALDENNTSTITKRSIKFGKIKSAFYNRLWRKVVPYKPAEFIAFGSELSKEAVRTRCRIGKSTKEIDLHTFDCQRFLDSSIVSPDYGDYCVFLDQYIPYHPDNIKDRGLSIDPQTYYDEMRCIIDAVAEKFCLSVVVAAHPRADYTDKEVFPDNYKIETGKTCELIKGAKLVLAHFSTAIGFVALADVPLCIVLPKSIRHISEFKQSSEAFAKLLGAKIITDPNDLKNINMTVDRVRYKVFAEKYMTCSTDMDLNNLWEPISLYIEQQQIYRKKVIR